MTWDVWILSDTIVTTLIIQAPPNLHLFVWRVYFITCLLVRIPGLFSVRGMFKIFVGKFFEFVSFTGALTSQHVIRPDKETSETVNSIPKETCQKVTRFDEPYRTACFWGVNETSKDGHVYDLGLCKFVEYFHVFPTNESRLRKEPAVPERDLQNMDGEKIDWQHILLRLIFIYE